MRQKPLGSFSSEAERHIVETFHRKFGVVPRLKIVDHISYEPRGKTRVVVDEAANTAGPA